MMIQQLPPSIKQFVESIRIGPLGHLKPSVRINFISKNIAYVGLAYELRDSLQQDDWNIIVRPSFTPVRYWSPHLTPTDDYIIAQHVFRSPALILNDHNKRLALIPDLNLMMKQSGYSWYLDLDAKNNFIKIGVAKSTVREHVLFVRDKGQEYKVGVFRFGFFLLMGEGTLSVTDPWRAPLEFLWKRWGKSLFQKGEPLTADLDQLSKYSYDWAFSGWHHAVWQEFTIGNTRVGAPVFIVNVTQSPNYPGPVNEREFRSIWNQVWFSSLRSAGGLYRYARRKGIDSLKEKARLTKELALAFPEKNGLFFSVVATPMKSVVENNISINRSTGWNHYYFGNSDRFPSEIGAGSANAPYHILDMSWTADQMLDWWLELEKDQRLLDYSIRYANRLITLQDPDGFYPAWLDTLNEKPLGFLDQSPETSMSVCFLLKLFEITKEKKYKESALKALHAVMDRIIEAGQWEDFETYWSCSRVFGNLVNRKIERNAQYKKNTLSMFWTADALYRAYTLTKDKNFISTGQAVLDELLMFQASWQPPFITVPALGGFGVMNADGEWNDSRQSLFAELLIRYGRLLNNEEYVQRGIAALKASFVMMYCPENIITKAQWEKVYPFFNSLDYGFMMENYGHGGVTNNQGLGMGEFTIYDWGNGAASEAYNRILDHFGKDIFQ
jgi:hypothetical protein